MKAQIKLVKKPTPIRNALLVCSLTCNFFLGMAAYGVYSGQLARTDISSAAFEGQEDYLSKITRRN